ncbi:unnamed protein product [Allacma fusca]|uniref:CUB domain-containing protein n=1 Tax=Allacma fusca TaxID=39272 RepID=A0A8J2JTG9_9HEXA|nr:unnamed protein product [Allacma fusca]
MKITGNLLLLALVCNARASFNAGNETTEELLEGREGRWLFSSSSSSKNSEESCTSSTSGQNNGNFTDSWVLKYLGASVPNNAERSLLVEIVPGKECAVLTSKNICQIRLDFIDFNLPAPDDQKTTNGNCLKGGMTINAENLKGFETCGKASGQRLYLHYGESDMITLNINVNNDATDPTNFDLFATFLPCSKGKRSGKRLNSGYNEASGNEANTNADLDDELAPSGCDQYYTAASGMVKSFNYVKPDATPKMQAQINNQQYTVCIRTPPGSKKITWQNCAVGDGFFISDVEPVTSKTGKDCESVDYVDIPGSQMGRYCGGLFPEGVESTARPFLMYVNFDQMETATGFFNERNTLINPETGCPVGAFCVTKNNEVVTSDGPPSSVLPCLSDEGVSKGQFCMTDPALSIFEVAESQNTGFCLKYTVLY